MFFRLISIHFNIVIVPGNEQKTKMIFLYYFVTFIRAFLLNEKRKDPITQFQYPFYSTNWKLNQNNRKQQFCSYNSNFFCFFFHWNWTRKENEILCIQYNIQLIYSSRERQLVGWHFKLNFSAFVNHQRDKYSPVEFSKLKNRFTF